MFGGKLVVDAMGFSAILVYSVILRFKREQKSDNTPDRQSFPRKTTSCEAAIVVDTRDPQWVVITPMSTEGAFHTTHQLQECDTNGQLCSYMKNLVVSYSEMGLSAAVCLEAFRKTIPPAVKLNMKGQIDRVQRSHFSNYICKTSEVHKSVENHRIIVRDLAECAKYLSANQHPHLLMTASATASKNHQDTSKCSVSVFSTRKSLETLIKWGSAILMDSKFKTCYAVSHRILLGHATIVVSQKMHK